MRTPLLTLAAVCALLLTPLATHTLAQTTAVVATPGAPNARVIVKYRAESTLLRMRALSASGQPVERTQALGLRTGLALRSGVGLAERTQVVFASGMSSDQLAQRLAAESDIEYAVPDQRRRAMVAPNDPLYLPSPPPANGRPPASGICAPRPVR